MESLQVFVRVPHADRERAGDASVSSSGYSGGETSDEQETPTSPAPSNAVGSKRKKTSYNMQKAEIARLKDEAEALERKLQRLDAKRPATIAREHLQLQSHVRANALLVAGAKSLVSSVKEDEPPVGTYIHLPVEELDRQRIFHAIKAYQIEDATAYMLARCQFTDLARASRQTELFTTAACDHVALLWEVIHITEGEPSVRCVFDEMLSFSRIREMAIAERTGRLDIRESDVDADPNDVAQSRILTDHKSGLLIEKNVVVHSHYFPPKTRDDKPYAVYVIDSVDQDDAFPYRPHERVRQDGVSVMLMLETPGSATETTPRSVAIVKYAFVRVRKSPLASDAALTELADDGLRSCFGVMVKIVRERLAARGPRAPVMEVPAPEAWSATHDETDFLMNILEGENASDQQPHHYSM